MKGDFEGKVARRAAELSERPFGELEDAVCAKRAAWCAEHAPSGRPRWTPRAAFELLFFAYMGLMPEDLPVVEETEERIGWESRNPCPTLEACRRLGLDTRRVCREVYQRPVQCFLSRLDPSLRFERDYGRIRPYADHCREGIRRVRLEEVRPTVDMVDRCLCGRPAPAEAAPGPGVRKAAVVAVLRDGAGPDGPEILLIRRAERQGDPWSGHLALPGGRNEPSDTSSLDTAVREVREEVGIDLGEGGRLLGRLGSVSTLSERLPRIAISPFVACAPRDAVLRPDPTEVAAAFWQPLRALLEAGRSATVRHEVDGRPREWPAWPTPHGPVWGITERILTDLFSLFG